jgi:hypothetical protein
LEGYLGTVSSLKIKTSTREVHPEFAVFDESDSDYINECMNKHTYPFLISQLELSNDRKEISVSVLPFYTEVSRLEKKERLATNQRENFNNILHNTVVFSKTCETIVEEPTLEVQEGDCDTNEDLHRKLEEPEEVFLEEDEEYAEDDEDEKLPKVSLKVKAPFERHTINQPKVNLKSTLPKKSQKSLALPEVIEDSFEKEIHLNQNSQGRISVYDLKPTDKQMSSMKKLFEQMNRNQTLNKASFDEFLIKTNRSNQSHNSKKSPDPFRSSAKKGEDIAASEEQLYKPYKSFNYDIYNHQSMGNTVFSKGPSNKSLNIETYEEPRRKTITQIMNTRSGSKGSSKKTHTKSKSHVDSSVILGNYLQHNEVNVPVQPQSKKGFLHRVILGSNYLQPTSSISQVKVSQDKNASHRLTGTHDHSGLIENQVSLPTDKRKTSLALSSIFAQRGGNPLVTSPVNTNQQKNSKMSSNKEESLSFSDIALSSNRNVPQSKEAQALTHHSNLVKMLHSRLVESKSSADNSIKSGKQIIKKSMIIQDMKTPHKKLSETLDDYSYKQTTKQVKQPSIADTDFGSNKKFSALHKLFGGPKQSMNPVHVDQLKNKKRDTSVSIESKKKNNLSDQDIRHESHHGTLHASKGQYLQSNFDLLKRRGTKKLFSMLHEGGDTSSCRLLLSPNQLIKSTKPDAYVKLKKSQPNTNHPSP